jgi:hypothetical protein
MVARSFSLARSSRSSLELKVKAQSKHPLIDFKASVCCKRLQGFGMLQNDHSRFKGLFCQGGMHPRHIFKLYSSSNTTDIVNTNGITLSGEKVSMSG